MDRDFLLNGDFSTYTKEIVKKHEREIDTLRNKSEPEKLVALTILEDCVWLIDSNNPIKTFGLFEYVFENDSKIMDWIYSQVIYTKYPNLFLDFLTTIKESKKIRDRKKMCIN